MRSQYSAGERAVSRADDLHEETGLSAGTVTDNDQLATDFRHLRDGLTEPHGAVRSGGCGRGTAVGVVMGVMQKVVEARCGGGC